MNGHASPKSRVELEGSLRRSFVEGATWPLSAPALAALLDMGLSEAAIADYFSVEIAAVERLRRHYRS